MGDRRYILHVDMDAFFASVEQMDNPQLKGKPVIVGGDPKGRGVVSAASYEARKFGVHSAMPMKTAKAKCPDCIILPVRMKRYSELSQKIHEIFSEYTPLFEPVSIDEAFLDVTGSISLFDSAENIGREIKKRIKKEVGLTASVGIGPNKFLAKLASDLEKPDGFVVIDEKNKRNVLDPLPVSKIYGVGNVIARHLKEAGLRTVKQVRQTPAEVLKQIVGNFAVNLKNLANGIDNSPVVPEHEAKSISSELTFEKDLTDKNTLLQVLVSQIEEVAQKLRKSKLCAKTVNLKFRYPDFKTLTRSRSLDNYTDLTDDLIAVGKEIFEKCYRKEKSPLRLLGFGVSNLAEKSRQPMMLFNDPDKEKAKKLDKTIDEIKNRFGRGSLKRGH